MLLSSTSAMKIMNNYYNFATTSMPMHFALCNQSIVLHISTTLQRAANHMVQATVLIATWSLRSIKLYRDRAFVTSATLILILHSI